MTHQSTDSIFSIDLSVLDSTKFLRTCPSEEFSTKIPSLLKSLKSLKNGLLVFLVACVKGKTQASDDYIQQSVTTEFFSNEEIEDALASLRIAGISGKLIFSEVEFMKLVLNGELQSHCARILVYNTAHSGTGPGRKALLPAFCALHKIPVTGSDAYTVNLARHKFHCNYLLRSFGVNTPQTWYYHQQSGWFENLRPPKGVDVILKLTYESASIGLDRASAFTVDDSLDLRVRRLSEEFRQPITVQSFISGWEVEVPVIASKRLYAPMAVGISKHAKQLLGRDFLTYDDVKGDDYGFWNFSEMNPSTAEQICKIAIKLSDCLSLTGFSRIDFRVTTDGVPFVTDISTSPHITEHSSFACLFKFYGLDTKDLLPTLIALACEREGWI